MFPVDADVFLATLIVDSVSSLTRDKQEDYLRCSTSLTWWNPEDEGKMIQFRLPMVQNHANSTLYRVGAVRISFPSEEARIF